MGSSATPKAETATKVCTICHETRPLDDFHRDAQKKDGRSSWCKPCTRAKARAASSAATPVQGSRPPRRQRYRSSHNRQRGEAVRKPRNRRAKRKTSAPAEPTPAQAMAQRHEAQAKARGEWRGNDY